MKSELVAEFGIPGDKVSVIPFGINNTVPATALSTAEAKRQLGISNNDKALLFFGNIAAYKGLEYLIAAFEELLKTDRSYRLLIVGKPKGPEGYWKTINAPSPAAASRIALSRRSNMSRMKKPNCISKRPTF